MDRPANAEIRRWIPAVASAVLGVGLVLALFRPPPIPALRSQPRRPPPILIRLDDGKDAAFDEKKMLADPTPLFLPTPWNAARKGTARPEPGATFENYPAKFSAASSEKELKLNLPTPVSGPETPIAALAMDRAASLLLGFGRGNATLPALTERGAFMEIVAAGTGQPVLRQSLNEAMPPGEKVWEPMEFLAEVDATGLVGTVAVIRRSGVEEVDSYFQRYLARTLRIGQRLAPGNYRISVGP